MAAHALSLRLTFVRNNTRHFTSVAGLATDSWVWFREPPNSSLERPARCRPLSLNGRRAMRLDPQERATLMRLLIEALDAETEEGVEDAWQVEIERRMAELDAGSVEAISWEEVRDRARRA